MEKKRSSQSGLALVTVLLLIAVIAAAVLILAIPGYQQHLKDAKLTMDIQSVQTCEDVASIRYLQDGAPGLQIYYYDELSHQCLDRAAIDSIEPYGRSSREQNLHGETGARGIPNLGEDHGGAQLLAVAVQEGTQVNIRWTGHDWSYLDYYYMYPAERETLTEAILAEMDRDTIVKAKNAAVSQYRKDFGKALDRGENPGTAIYDYNALNDSAVYDVISGTLPDGKNVTTGSPTDFAAYGLSSEQGNSEGCILRVTVSYDEDHQQEAAETEWVEGNHG